MSESTTQFSAKVFCCLYRICLSRLYFCQCECMFVPCKVWTWSIFLIRTYNCVCVCTNTSLGVCTDGVTLLREHNDINNILSLFQHHEAHRIKTHVQFACWTTELHAKQCIANRTIFRFPVFNCFVLVCLYLWWNKNNDAKRKWNYIWLYPCCNLKEKKWGRKRTG